MEKANRILSSLLVMLLLTACSPMLVPPADSQTEGNESAADLLAFYSIEDFIDAIQEEGISEENNDIISWTGYDIHYMLSNIPAGYDLGKIIAGSADIMFCYYPSDSLASRNDMMLAEASQSCFELVYRHWEFGDPLAGIMKQIGQADDDLIDGKYLFDSTVRTYYWIEDEYNVCSLHLPEGYSVSAEELSGLCAVIPIDLTSQNGGSA